MTITFHTDIDRTGQHWWWFAEAHRTSHGITYLCGIQTSRTLGLTFQRKAACKESLESFLDDWQKRLEGQVTLAHAISQLVEIEHAFPETRADETPLVVIPHPEYGYVPAGSIRIADLQTCDRPGTGDWVEPDPTDSALGRVEQVIVIEVAE